MTTQRTEPYPRPPRGPDAALREFGTSWDAAERAPVSPRPSHLLYEALVRPVDRVDAVVDTRDLNAPRLVRLGILKSV